MVSQDEKRLFELQKEKLPNKEMIHKSWTEMLADFSSNSARNYCFMFHIMTPSAFAFEQLYQNSDSIDKLTHALMIAAFEGTNPRRFKSPGTNSNVIAYYCAITKGEGTKQKLLVEKAKLGSHHQATGDLSKIGELSDRMFQDLRNKYIGFNCEPQNELHYFGVPLYGGEGRKAGYQTQTYLSYLWNPKVGSDSTPQGKLSQILFNALLSMDQFPFSEKSIGQPFFQKANLRTKATRTLSEIQKCDFLGIDDTLVFSWLFHPNSKDLDGFVSGIVSKSSSKKITI